MPAVLQQRYTLSAPGGRYYTFTPRGAEVEVRFRGPHFNITTTVPVAEARALYARLLRRGFERW